PPPPSATPQVDFGSLLREMADLGELSLRPNPNYRTLQFSSYDRSSGAPYTSGWFANSDGFGNEPTPNVLAVLRPPDAEAVGYYLLAEVDGPGALTRTWTTHPWPIDGYLRVLIDGNDEPLY